MYGIDRFHIVTGFAIWSSNPANLANPFPLELSEACQGVHNPMSDPIILHRLGNGFIPPPREWCRKSFTNELI